MTPAVSRSNEHRGRQVDEKLCPSSLRRLHHEARENCCSSRCGVCMSSAPAPPDKTLQTNAVCARQTTRAAHARVVAATRSTLAAGAAQLAALSDARIGLRSSHRTTLMLSGPSIMSSSTRTNYEQAVAVGPRLNRHYGHPLAAMLPSIPWQPDEDNTASAERPAELLCLHTAYLRMQVQLQSTPGPTNPEPANHTAAEEMRHCSTSVVRAPPSPPYTSRALRPGSFW